MAKNEEKFMIIGKKKDRSTLFQWILVGILVFIAVYMPFFGANLRYQTSSILKTVMNVAGTWILTIGGFMVAFGFIGCLMRSSHWMEWLIVGGIMIWVGSWLTGAPFALIDIFFSSESAGSSGGGGYH